MTVYRFSRRTAHDARVLYAVGAGKRVFALAKVIREVYRSGVADWPVSAGVSVDEISTADRDLVRPIQRGASYIRLSEEEYEQAVIRLQEAQAAHNRPAGQ